MENYSNKENTYVYNVRILDDILSTGTTDSYGYLEDKFVVTKEDDEFKLALNGYCGKEQLNIIVEDDYLKTKIVKKRIIYDREVYTVEFTNKTSNYIVLANGEEDAEICLEIQGQTRTADKETAITLLPNEKTTVTISFDKYFDDGKEATQFILNAIRVLPEYSGDSSKLKTEMKNAIKLYSRIINLKEI